MHIFTIEPFDKLWTLIYRGFPSFNYKYCCNTEQFVSHILN